MAAVANGMLNSAGASPPPPPPPPPPPLPQSQTAAAVPKPHHVSSHHRHHEHKGHPKDSHKKPHESDTKRRDKGKPDLDKAAKAKHQQQPPPAAAPPPALQADNRLRRDTPFLATLRFKNDLPEIPGDPKLLVTQVESSRLSAFSLTTLEREPKRDLVMPADLGIPISLLNVERYAVPAEAVGLPLEPEDQALMGAGEDKSTTYSTAAMAPRALALRNTQVSWLMRTTYIAQDSNSVRRPGYNEKKAKALREAATTLEDEEGEGREAQIAAIEATFEAAQQLPVHHKNPALKPVEILPVFPDFQCWANKYVQAHFDNDPTEEVEALARLPAAIRGKVAARSMLKGFKVDNNSKQQGEQQQERFMALVVPERIPEGLAAEAAGGAADEDVAEVDPSELEGDYTWSKEYVYDIIRREQDMDNKQEYFIRFRDGVASYCDIHTRLELKKRGEMRGEAVQPARPAKVMISRREPTEAEEADRARKMRRLYGQNEEEGMEE